jgi:hypothetical protein
MLAALEKGGCRIARCLPELEAAMTGWQPGQHQPDSVAAAVITYDTLAGAGGQRWTVAAPVGVGGSYASASSAGGTGGGFTDRLGSRHLAMDAMVAQTAATKSDDTERHYDSETEAARVVSMDGYRRRIAGSGGYDPLANFGPVMRSRRDR